MSRHVGVASALACALLLTLPIARSAAAQATISGRGRAADLGIGRLEASRVTLHAADGWMEFGSEPRLYDVRPGGPAAGKIREGDVLVAVEGDLVTTRAGALRLANLRPFRPARLTIRRDGRNLDVVLTPVPGEAVPTPPRRVPVAPPSPFATPTPPMAPPPLPSIPIPPPRPKGRATLGMSFSCSDCGFQENGDDEVWFFRNTLPLIEAVQPRGAAARAGLQVGDRIETIDGVALATPEGGRRFGGIKPGQLVRLGVRRGNALVQLSLRAEAAK